MVHTFRRLSIGVACAALLLTLAVGHVHADVLYISDTSFDRIWKYAADGTRSALSDPSHDVIGPTGLTLDVNGNLFIASGSASRIVKGTSAGISSIYGFTGSISGGAGLAFDSAGTLYAVNFLDAKIWKVASDGTSSLFVGTGLAAPTGIAVDKSDNLYVANSTSNTIVKITPGGISSVFASTDLNQPFGLTFDTAGNLYAANYGDGTIAKFTTGGASSIFVGPIGDRPVGLAFDSAGNLYAGFYSGTITRYDSSGVGTFFGKTGSPTFAFIAIQVPEPSTLALGLLGAIGAYFLARKRHAS
jgi:DNA-binding beta-propeller fold protein YncE